MSGRFRLDVQQVSLGDIVSSALDSIEPTARTKGVRLESVLDPQSVVVSGDPARLQQVFWNLLSNAVKFTPKGGKIQVVLQRVNSHIEFSISDTGIGIPAAFLPHVFERFSQKGQLDAPGVRRVGVGTRNLQAAGGPARRLDPGEKHGRRPGRDFCRHASAHHPREERDPAARVHPTAAELSEVVPMPRLDGVRALVVDDEADALELIQRVLENQGAHVTTVRSGDAALRLLETSTPDVLISDIGMPAMDGYQFMRPHEGGRTQGAPHPRPRAYRLREAG
jgi:CheY-like chemotaxis protein